MLRRMASPHDVYKRAVESLKRADRLPDEPDTEEEKNTIVKNAEFALHNLIFSASDPDELHKRLIHLKIKDVEKYHLESAFSRSIFAGKTEDLAAWSNLCRQFANRLILRARRDARLKLIINHGPYFAPKFTPSVKIKPVLVVFNRRH